MKLRSSFSFIVLLLHYYDIDDDSLYPLQLSKPCTIFLFQIAVLCIIFRSNPNRLPTRHPFFLNRVDGNLVG